MSVTLELESARRKLADLPAVDFERMATQRLDRLQAEMVERDIGGLLLYDPVNVRYATGTRNMQVWTMHNSSLYCLVPAEGQAVVFNFVNCEHLSEHLPTVAESRPAKMWLFHVAGAQRSKVMADWAGELASEISERCGNNRLAVDRLDGDPRRALEACGIEVSFGQDIVEYARRIKTADELAAQRRSAAICASALTQMREATRPGVTENELWSILMGVNVALGGDYTESRLVVSGPRTNPWYTESSDRIVQAGELLALDTDMVGQHGYSCDISRTWLCHPGTPTAEQRSLYGLAYEQVHHNLALLRGGLTMRELVERSWRIPDRYEPFECVAVIHGIGLCNEYPQLVPRKLFDDLGYDAVLEPDMTVCVESYIGERGGHEGVKLEEMVRITDTGYELIGEFPFEEELLQ